MTTFRHKCEQDFTLKYTTPEAYHACIRKEYEVPEDAWRPMYDTPAPLARLGLLQETGREIAIVNCPDCGAEVVVTRTKE